jgi:hypothetical protein
MAKRANRLRAINHERSQIEMIKHLTPNTTLPNATPLSNHLLDIANEALREVGVLETGKEPSFVRLKRLVALVDSLPEKVEP